MLMGCGAQCVMTDGTTEMQMLYADNCNLMGVSYLLFPNIWRAGAS